jgi:transcriptional regulator with XRE-family HTH domain
MDSRTRRVHRVSVGLSQAAVAAAVGVSQSHYSQIELGRITPDAELAAKIAAALNTTPDKLFPAQQQGCVLVQEARHA